MPVLLLVLALLVAGSQSGTQSITIPDGVRAAADRITADRLARDLEFLASDALAGRNTPSPGFDTAAVYISSRLEQAGVRPLGDRGTFFQQYAMHETRVNTAAAYIDVGGRRFRFGDDFVMRSYAGPLSGELPLVYVGHGWTVPDRGIDPYAGLDVRGKILLAHGPRALPKGVEIRQIGRVAVGANTPLVEAARRGAAGIIFIAQTSALKGWNGMRTGNLVRRELEPPVPSAYAATPVTSVLVAPTVTEALLAGERLAGPELVAQGDAGDYPPSFQLVKSVTVHVPATTIVHRPYNVVAVIEGSDPVLKAEYVTVASHLDGAVGTRSVDGDDIYNSADDNATGSAANLAIAEQMMRGPRPRRSIIFIWDSGEEQGLWGTRQFVGKPPVPLENIVAHFNIDMIGASRAPGSPDADSKTVTGTREVYLVGPGVLSRQAHSLIEHVNRDYLNLSFNRAYDTPTSEFFYPRTDAGPFLERGILTIGFFTGLHERYHRPADEARFL
ncbi:MAG TPA: M28 family peptidase, partial [Vicinamibacterales bacterium]|nr:M28 family peptidase [Vicinamibacterales bacterium]